MYFVNYVKMRWLEILVCCLVGVRVSCSMVCMYVCSVGVGNRLRGGMPCGFLLFVCSCVTVCPCVYVFCVVRFMYYVLRIVGCGLSVKFCVLAFWDCGLKTSDRILNFILYPTTIRRKSIANPSKSSRGGSWDYLSLATPETFKYVL